MVQIESKEIQPTQEEKIAVFGSTQYGGVLANEARQKFVGMVSLRAFDSGEDSENARIPLVLVAVVDKSGSMSGAKIESLKQTLHFVLRELGKNDQFGIIEYDTQVNTALPLTVMNDSGKGKAKTAIDGIRTGSSTNLSGGFQEGLRMFPTSSDTKVVSSLLLMTDGLANAGITSTQGIISMFQKTQAEGIGRCSVNTFGFGSDHDAKMLKDISSAGEGMYYYIENEDSIPAAFADCLGGLLSVVGQGIELKLVASPNHLIEHVWTAKPVTQLEPNRSYRIALGDLQEGEERDVPFEISLPAGSAVGLSSIVSATLTYFDVKAETMKEFTRDVLVERVEVLTDEHKTPNLLVDRNCNRCKTAKALEDAASIAAKRGDLKPARDLLETVIAEISASPSSGEEFCQGLLTELRTALSGLKDRVSYDQVGQYQLNSASHALNMQRSAPMSSMQSPMAFACYETSARSRMKSKFI